MKLIVQIPCYNEEQTLPRTVADIPRQIEGIDVVEVLVVDDGSTDDTIAVALASGVDHIVRHKCNRGLAGAFRSGIDACLRLGADIVVNTDGDNQYCGADIPRLVEPILRGRADMVIGDRQTSQVPHFSRVKKLLQFTGSCAVRKLSGTTVPDAVSGFRAFSKEGAVQLNIVSPFSYTIETVIQAGKKKISTASVPIRTNGKTRESRLFSSLPEFLRRSGVTILRMYTMYEPLRVFLWISAVLFAMGLFPIIRFLYFYFTGAGDGHIQSLVLGGSVLLMGFVTAVAGIVADLISFNRQLIEVTLQKMRAIEIELSAGSASQNIRPAHQKPLVSDLENV